MLSSIVFTICTICAFEQIESNSFQVFNGHPAFRLASDGVLYSLYSSRKQKMELLSLVSTIIIIYLF